MPAPDGGSRVVAAQRPFRLVSEGGVVVAGNGGMGVHLPATAALVWRLLEHPSTIDELVRAVAARHPEVDADEVRVVVTDIVATLGAEGIVVASTPADKAPVADGA